MKSWIHIFHCEEKKEIYVILFCNMLQAEKSEFE